MPISKSLSKIQKNIKTKKPTIHPKGRKLQQLTRATLRENKIKAKKRAHIDKKSNSLARVKFIQDIINSNAFKNFSSFSLEQIGDFIQTFINRDDSELEELISKRRVNRPPIGRQQLLQHKKNLEQEEFKSGFLCPDLTDESNVTFLRNWNQSFGSLSNLRLIRINDKYKKVIGGNRSVSDNNDVEML